MASEDEALLDVLLGKLPANHGVVAIGGSEIDYQTGTPSDDLLYGAGGNDVQVGGGGDDDIWGGIGNDNQSGGVGVDWFYISVYDGHDTISDFKPEQGDRIGLAFANLAELQVAEHSLTASPQGDVVAHYGETTVTLTGVPYVDYADDGVGLFARA